jgi:transposase
MPRALSMDLAERIASAIIRAEESHPLIAERFEVSVSTVERISRRMREGAPLTRTEHSGGAQPLLGEEHHAYIAQQLEETPFVSSYELAERFNAHFVDLQVHRSTILRAMHAAGFSFKKKSRTRRKGTVPTS